MAAFTDINEVSDRHLHIIWVNADPVASVNMVMMYSKNSMLNKWWDRVTVVPWGPTQTLFLNDETVRASVRSAEEAGVEFSACITCSNNLGITEDLQKQQIETVRWGQKLTMLLQNGKHVITI